MFDQKEWRKKMEISIKPHYRLCDIIKTMKDGDIRIIKKGIEEIEIKKMGFMVFYKCEVCEDISRCKVGACEFCINQHKDAKGTELQPASDGINMQGKKWSATPAGTKEKKKG